MPNHYNIVINGEDEDKWFPVSELGVGALAEIHPRNERHAAHAVLRCTNVLVSLTDPEVVFDTPATAGFLVRLLKYPEEVVLSPTLD